MKNAQAILAAVLFLASCQQINLGKYGEATNDDTYEVNITSKSSDPEEAIPYPLTVYAVNSDGLVESKASVDESANSVNLSLISGDFTFYAIAGANASNSDVPDNNIITAENGYFTTPIMQGKTTATIDDNEEIGLTLSYAVASVDVTLSNIPSDVKAVSVKIGTLKKTMTIDKEYDGTTTATIDLEKQANGTTWKSATVYVFPSVSTPTTLTITQTMNDNTTKSFAASYNAKLSAGTPYHFTGTGTSISNHELTVNITTDDWENPIDEELTMTPIESGDGEGTLDNDGETYWVSEIPTESGTILDGKYVLAYVSGNQGLLYAKKDCTEGEEANYKEGNITGWSIPTLEQYNNIKTQAGLTKIASAIDTANNAKKTADKYPFSDYFYYNDSQLAFKWSSSFGSNTVQIEGNEAKCHLRLVKEVTFKIQ